MWRYGTSIPVTMHGLKLFNSFDRDSKMKQLALRVPEEKVCTIDGYDLILAEILPQYSMFLEQDTDVQIEKTMFMIRRDEKELFTSYLTRKYEEYRNLTTVLGHRTICCPHCKATHTEQIDLPAKVWNYMVI